MPTVPRNTALIPQPPHFAFPNLVPPARIVPPDFELWPEVRINQQALVSLDLAGVDLYAIALPVIPTIPPTVASGDLITASHENSVRQALNDLWIDVQALATSAHNEATWSQNVDAAGHNLSNVGTLGATTLNATNGSFSGTLSANTLTTNTITATGAITGASLSTAGALNAGSVSTGAITATGAITGASLSTAGALTAASIESALFRSVPDMVFQVGAGYPERMRITAGGNVGIGTANPQSLLHVAGGALFNGLIDTSGSFRVTGNATPASGAGMELIYSSGTGGGIYVYDRGGGAFKELTLDGWPKIAINSQTRGATRIHTASDALLNIDSTFGTDVVTFQVVNAAVVAYQTMLLYASNFLFRPQGTPRFELLADGTVKMWLGGSLKTLSVDGSGFVKAA